MTAVKGVQPRIVRKMAGPYLTRACLQEGRTFRWFESLKQHPAPYLGAGEIELVTGITRSVGQHVSLPNIPDEKSALWEPVQTPRLLCDDLFDSSQGKVLTLGETVRNLGVFLGLLHLCEIPENSLPLRLEPAWLQMDREARKGISGALKGLPIEECPQLRADADRMPVLSLRTFVHGRFSTGLVVSRGVFKVMGWREAGFGDPRVDVAYLLSEIVEAAAVADLAVESGCSLIQGFLDGYREACDPSLDLAYLESFVAERILKHYAQSTWAFGENGQIGEILHSVEQAWIDLRPSFEASGHE
ncbi:hypothetical protein [Streptomyces sp. NPDC059452]|uniref:hypothetical protein n=1 Tax=Streptomyces sp. NPDC059452 TaxID=3346835 RepID=UPI0036A5E38F